MHKSASKSHVYVSPLLDKLFYRIGEASKIVGVQSHVLRYWETEFPFLKPRKNKSGHRVYVKRDIESLLNIKRLLYKERYTIEGVRKKLGSGHIHTADPEAKTAEIRNPAEVISHVRKRLIEILSQLK